MNKLTITVITLALLLFTMPFEAQSQDEKGEASSNALELLNFEGSFADRFIQLKWNPITNPEDVKHYYIQYARDGKTFTSIGKTYTNLKNHYTFNSIVFHAGVNYYRIVEVNKDNTERVSHKINVMCGFADRYVLDLKKGVGEIKFMFQVKNDQKVVMEVLDSKGNLKQALFNGDMMKGEIIFRTINTSEWEKGKYYLSLRGVSFRENKEIWVD